MIGGLSVLVLRDALGRWFWGGLGGFSWVWWFGGLGSGGGRGGGDSQDRDGIRGREVYFYFHWFLLLGREDAVFTFFF